MSWRVRVHLLYVVAVSVCRFPSLGGGILAIVFFFRIARFFPPVLFSFRGSLGGYLFFLSIFLFFFFFLFVVYGL